MRATGSSGELRAGYQQAAELGAWEIDIQPRLPRSFQFRARVLSVHGYWSQQHPLDLVLALGTTEWRWTGVTPVYEGDDIVIELTSRPHVIERASGITGGQR